MYIIKNKLNHYYTGICTDLERRFEEHSSMGPKCAKALRGKGPLELVYAVELDSQSEALKAELWVKKQTKLTKSHIVEKSVDLPFSHKHCAPLIT